VQEEYPDTGVPYVLAGHAARQSRAEREPAGDPRHELGEAAGDLLDDAEREIRVDGGTDCALDGHVPHSKAQLMICHWLYMSEIAHAPPRRAGGG
jgi:hypothetical protein